MPGSLCQVIDQLLAIIEVGLVLLRLYGAQLPQPLLRALVLQLLLRPLLSHVDARGVHLHQLLRQQKNTVLPRLFVRHQLTTFFNIL